MQVKIPAEFWAELKERKLIEQARLYLPDDRETRNLDQWLSAMSLRAYRGELSKQTSVASPDQTPQEGQS
jgi:hypothetical protein